MINNIQSALDTVLLLTAASKKKAAKTTKKVAKKKAKKKVAKKKATSASAISAMNTPNLRMINKLISRGLLGPEEIVGAVREALRLYHMNVRLADAVASAVGSALGMSEDVVDIDVGPTVGASSRRRRNAKSSI